MDSLTPPTGGRPTGDAHTYGMPLARLSLTPEAGHGPLDGAWRPRCDALELELPALVGSLDPGRGTVTRVTVGAAAWPDAPLTVSAPDHVIEVVLSDATAEEHAISLDCGTTGRWELLVIPPDEPAGTADRLLTAAADPWSPLSAQRTLARVEDGLGRESTEARRGP
ncbi:hypothetical protein EDD90_5844 [Streptomyces sp. Ag109_O5-1]|uniref:DUF5994 family protein n=1 Tax=Streptomyces sp. Ag109_O5-1 TaxID=1938851 RepID=UPI000F9E8E2A|nr:DUF5994 family protein [Streptomyces sp. Ag109_O5-1]RPE42690.1 hypothetical protein EDD90_5844 [Streptomyces sp. Ag109_O5-1]